MTGTNTFTGATNLTGGLIQFSTLANLGAAASTAPLNFNGGGLQWAANLGTAVDLSASTRALTFAGTAIIDTNGNQVSFAHAVGGNGAGGITKAGDGTLFLQGANTYTGATTISNGVLNLQNAQALGTGSAGVTISNGTLALQGAGTIVGTQTLTLNGNGALYGQSGALVNVSGTNEYDGPLVLGSSATISVDGGSVTLGSGTAVTGTGTLTLAGAGSGTLSGGLSMTGGGLIKNGAGTWTLSGIGNYTGSTVINGGTLAISSGALGSTSDTTLNGGALVLNGGSQNIGNLFIGAGTANTVTVLGPSSTLTIGSITNGTGGTVFFSNVGSTIATTATGSGPNHILGFALDNDGSGIGMARINGSGHIVRFDSVDHGGLATQLTDSSNNGADFTTLTITTLGNARDAELDQRRRHGQPGGRFADHRSERRFNCGHDHQYGSGDQRADDLTSGAIQFANTAGWLGKRHARLVARLARPTRRSSSTLRPERDLLTLGSLVSGGTGSYTQDGGGTVILSGNNTYTGAIDHRWRHRDGRRGFGDRAWVVANNNANIPTQASGALGVNSAVTLDSGATLDLNGFSTIVGSLTGSGETSP